MWMVILSWCLSVTLVMSLIFCLCWGKKTPKDEWQGLDGMVTQKNPDENVNHLPSAASCVVDGMNACGDSTDSKRNAVTNTRRSLPDIPSEQGNAVNWDPMGDNSSELYATVGQYQNQNNAKRHTIANGVDSRPSISQHSSISQADDTFSPYERVKYDKIHSKEHPYAQLQPTTSRSIVVEEPISTSEERINSLRVEITNPSEPSVPTRSRRSSTHSSSTVGGLDIPAASAVAGVLAASPELPYMTPPVTQSNFSGDSQDSSKGYTSISVREPLANIIAQTKELHKNKRELDPHYSTVSDDSDDVYTTIPDPNNPVYTSESETYARIPPLSLSVEVEVNPTPPPERQAPDPEQEPVDILYEPPPPQPPSVDSLKQATGHNSQVVHTHSRQASSSSSIANLGSPKPEKRQANSPLPPPPMVCNFDFHVDKLQSMRNLDDLYAKVHKNKKDEVTNDKTVDKLSSTPESMNSSSSRPISGISLLESSLPEKLSKEHNYETLKKSPRRTSDPGYEKIRGSDEPGYASINGPESITNSDPGYEVLKDRANSESDPNYEELRHRVSNASDCSGYSRIKEKDINDGYSVVNKRKKKLVSLPAFNADDALDEPNYESMPSETNSEPNYAALQSNGSEFDPNYESVDKKDPNYESVKYLDDPPYERLDEESSKTSSDISGYEKVRKKGELYDTSESSNSAGKSLSDKTDPPYEQLNNDTDSEVPGYEKIKKKSVLSPNSSGSSVEPINSSDILDEDGIFQV